MLRRIATITLLSVMLFGVGGYFLVFKAEQWSIRSKMSQELLQAVPESRLHRFSSDQLDAGSWEHKGKEFSYQGKMYDVVRTVTGNGVTLYYCIADDEETSLIDVVGKTIEHQHSQTPGKQAAGFLRFFFSLDYYPTQHYFICRSFSEDAAPKTPFSLPVYKCFSAERTGPPPEMPAVASLS